MMGDSRDAELIRLLTESVISLADKIVNCMLDNPPANEDYVEFESSSSSQASTQTILVELKEREKQGVRTIPIKPMKELEQFIFSSVLDGDGNLSLKSLHKAFIIGTAPDLESLLATSTLPDCVLFLSFTLNNKPAPPNIFSTTSPSELNLEWKRDEQENILLEPNSQFWLNFLQKFQNDADQTPLLQPKLVEQCFPLSPQNVSFSDSNKRERQVDLGSHSPALINFFEPFEKTHEYPSGRGILLWGPPGTGKSTVMKYILSKLPMAIVFDATAASLFRSYVGESAKLLETIALWVRTHRFWITCMCIDEFDAAFAAPGTNDVPAHVLQLTTSLQTLIGDDNPSLVVVSATNFKENIPQPIIRPGRIDCHLFCGPASFDQRDKIVHEKKFLPWTVNFGHALLKKPNKETIEKYIKQYDDGLLKAQAIAKLNNPDFNLPATNIFSTVLTTNSFSVVFDISRTTGTVTKFMQSLLLFAYEKKLSTVRFVDFQDYLSCKCNSSAFLQRLSSIFSECEEARGGVIAIDAEDVVGVTSTETRSRSSSSGSSTTGDTIQRSIRDPVVLAGIRNLARRATETECVYFIVIAHSDSVKTSLMEILFGNPRNSSPALVLSPPRLGFTVPPTNV